jgi:hyperosmotically inducible protein
MNRLRNVRRVHAWLLIFVFVLPFTLACGKTIGETIDDAAITARVKTALLNDSQVAGMKIDVDTTKGVVTMSGVVKSREEESRALELAKQVGGVREVKSTLQVAAQQ